ncbi:MAG: VOC family protein [Nitrospira sp.]|nr:VOC family protein [Nitrospira sp.]MCY4132739.1 VOC family protein [Nitrospira sp.]
MGSVFFHLAFPVHDLDEARRFYVDGLGCTLGRRTSHAMVMEFYHHQIVAQLTAEPLPRQKGIYPRHFGLVFTDETEWKELVERARTRGLKFYQQPRRRFPGTRLEHQTFFLEDPSHNLLEFKHYTHETAIFGEQDAPVIGDEHEPR